jgi:hypothetical protein
MSVLEPRDRITTTHRNHGHVLARGADPGRAMAEILGRASGLNGGRGGTIHLSDPDLGFLSTSGIVGGCISLGVGGGYPDGHGSTPVTLPRSWRRRSSRSPKGRRRRCIVAMATTSIRRSSASMRRRKSTPTRQSDCGREKGHRILSRSAVRLAAGTRPALKTVFNPTAYSSRQDASCLAPCSRWWGRIRSRS